MTKQELETRIKNCEDIIALYRSKLEKLNSKRIYADDIIYTIVNMSKACHDNSTMAVLDTLLDIINRLDSVK